jgi:hypothetical protein
MSIYVEAHFYQRAVVGSLHKWKLIPTLDDIHDMVYTCMQNKLPQTPHHSVAIPRTLNPKIINFNNHISGQGHTYIIGSLV